MKHKGTKATEEETNEVSRKILGAAIEVHKSLGPGLLESAYEKCLAHEFSLRGLTFERQVRLPVIYKGMLLDCGYRMDFIVNEIIVLEIKSVEHVLPLHAQQVLTYLRLFGFWLGLLLNFNVEVLRQGISRIVNGSPL